MAAIASARPSSHALVVPRDDDNTTTANSPRYMATRVNSLNDASALHDHATDANVHAARPASSAPTASAAPVGRRTGQRPRPTPRITAHQAPIPIIARATRP